MGQMTWRVDDELLGRARAAAERSGRSLNEFVSVVIDAVTDPHTAGDEALALRERLARKGLLAELGPPRARPSKARVARARKAAGQGTSLTELVRAERG